MISPFGFLQLYSLREEEGAKICQAVGSQNPAEDEHLTGNGECV